MKSLVSRIHLMLPRMDLKAVVTFLMKNGEEHYSYVGLPIEEEGTIPDEHLQQLKVAEVLVTTTHLLGIVLYTMPCLKWAHVTFAGVEELMTHYQADQPEPTFVVTRLAGRPVARELAEWVLAAVLGHERRFHQAARAQLQHRWAQHEHSYRPLAQLTIGVMGTGQMGGQVGALMKQLGCTVLGLARTEQPANDSFDRIYTTDRLLEFLQSADYVCNLLPSTPATRGLLSPAVLGQLRHAPVLVNAGRADVVHQPHLVLALRRGWLSAAVLDVFETEPLPADSPLWDMDQVTITPHVGNLTRPHAVAQDFLDNLERYNRGEPLLHVVDWKRGY